MSGLDEREKNIIIDYYYGIRIEIMLYHPSDGGKSIDFDFVISSTEEILMGSSFWKKPKWCEIGMNSNPKSLFSSIAVITIFILEQIYEYLMSFLILSLF